MKTSWYACNFRVENLSGAAGESTRHIGLNTMHWTARISYGWNLNDTFYLLRAACHSEVVNEFKNAATEVIDPFLRVSVTNSVGIFDTNHILAQETGIGIDQFYAYCCTSGSNAFIRMVLSKALSELLDVLFVRR